MLYQQLFADYGAVYLGNVANAGVVMGTRGVALSVLYRLHLTFWSLLGGLFVLFEKDRVTKADIEHEVELEEHEEGQPRPPDSATPGGGPDSPLADAAEFPQQQDR